MSNGNQSVCSSGTKLIFSCSGAADVGEIADRVARKITKDGVGTMFCMAGIGGRVEPIMKKTQSASKVVAIDGCELDCVKKCLQEAGFADFSHIRVTDLGMEKGKSAANETTVGIVVQAALALLA